MAHLWVRGANTVPRCESMLSKGYYRRAEEPGSSGYQTSQRFFGTIPCPGLQEKACWNAGVAWSVPLMR
jgi:hypothetical protein